MTELTKQMYDDMDDVELIVTYLQGRLPDERAAAVKRRLKEDPAFLEFAAPLLLTWSVPKHIERKPRPEGELERDWAEFVKRTGFPNRPQEPPPAATPAPDRVLWSSRRTWERIMWFVVAFMVVVPLGATVWYDVIKPNYFPEPTDGYVAPAVPAAANPKAAAEFPFEPAPPPVTDLVPYQSGWITLENGIHVKLEPGAELRVAQRRLSGMRHLLLKGTARFRVPFLDPPEMSMRPQSLVVETPVGFVTASESEFTVAAGADTTALQIHALPPHGKIPPSPMTLAPVLMPVDVDQILVLLEPGNARLVRGRNPVRLPSSR